jgi:aryl-alcohol dehydrogenase-like predicted oxidoreductase
LGKRQTKTMKLADVPAVGLGCMNLSHAYGRPPSREVAESILHRAFELGIRHFDSAALYGFGKNETLLGPVLKLYRKDILLVSKGGMTGVDGKRVIDGRPETILKSCDESLQRLQTDVIDLYYLHRWDKNIPLEDSMGAIKQLVEKGKVLEVGLSEVSADTLRKAHAIHPIAAVQSEYSLWSRNAEVAVLDACAELGIVFIAFSPLARGFLTDTDLVPDEFAEKDIRRFMPRFQEPHFSKNTTLLGRYRELAREAGCTAAQLALAWLLHRPGIHVIPGTTSLAHLEENYRALEISLDAGIIDQVDATINSSTVSGPRYNAATQAEIDTEEIVG